MARKKPAKGGTMVPERTEALMALMAAMQEQEGGLGEPGEGLGISLGQGGLEASPEPPPEPERGEPPPPPWQPLPTDPREATPPGGPGGSPVSAPPGFSGVPALGTGTQAESIFGDPLTDDPRVRFLRGLDQRQRMPGGVLTSIRPDLLRAFEAREQGAGLSPFERADSGGGLR